MDIDVSLSCEGVDWKAVSDTLKSVNMAFYEPEIHRKAFEASHTTVFAYHESKLIGFGRAISDGTYQAAIYDCAVREEFQGKGIGKIIMNSLLSELSHCNIVLYASPGKEGFYQSLGFRKMKTGMAYFQKNDVMRRLGFIE
ncbi:GNAT family N-acetyltransferase [Desulfoluna spongiiphila]|uniref:Acetyltransferase (GNAT) domain-containing protein n=1 Tax=Desulfoluna spongiiphila TaxID=419481 RepID=A0A1G5F7B9_9BACT|nr:GNAT family N-acetyltransferase [Desulfoluna spongiiphila]SCY35103.1 Acetyltransferase (GNAT) domain-containing protein [Desulfoluna spongiiphila]